MTPAERNRVRRIRDLLDAFERVPAQRLTIADQLVLAAGELSDVAREAHDQHVAEVNERSRQTLDGLLRLSRRRCAYRDCTRDPETGWTTCPRHRAAGRSTAQVTR